jgi:hypothetical protein
VDSLLTNAVQSIQIGIEDFGSTDSRRILSTVRNLSQVLARQCTGAKLEFALLALTRMIRIDRRYGAL